jgi:Uri superfamily endonuclease
MGKKGTYCLCVEVNKKMKTNIGALGEILFNPGKYVYVGSALNNLELRINRHIRTNIGENNVIHWHIDYLLKENDVKIIKFHYLDNGKRMECKIAKKISHYGKMIQGFGSSDCKCKSHLFHVNEFNFLEKIGVRDTFLMG